MERGFNYLAGRENIYSAGWQQTQSRFFNQAEDWMYRAIPTDRNHPDYLTYRRGIGSGIELGCCLIGGYGAANGGIKAARWGSNLFKARRGAFSVAEKLTISKEFPKISSFPRSTPNPLQEANYTRKVLSQMENNLKTGVSDFHGFPRIVDNYAGLGQKELIKGKDGIASTTT